MKKTLAFLLSLTLLFSLFGCAKTEEVKEDPSSGEEKIDLSTYSAEALYDFAYTKTRAQKRALFETEISFQNEAEPMDTIKTVRIREGYDGFSLSRVGKEMLYYMDETLSVKTDLGAFSSAASTREAEEYMTKFWFPVTLPAPESVTDLTRAENVLSFTLKSEETLPLFQNAVPEEKGEFLPKSVSCQAEITEEGIAGVTLFFVEGTLNGENTVLELATVLTKIKSEEIALDQPPADTFQAIGSVQVPHLLEKAIASLEIQKPLQCTLLSSEKITVGEQVFSLYTDSGVYESTAEGTYLSRQSLKSVPEADQQSLFYQFLLKDGVKTENEYDVIKGELLSESTAEGTFSFAEFLSAYLPELSDLSEISFSEDGKQISISFALNENGIAKAAKTLAETFPESALSPETVTGKGSGVFTLDAETGLLVAASFVLEGASDTAAVTCQYSVTVDGTEEAPLPEFQVPTATTPGEGGDEHHDDF